jgi:hypothetical protein
MSKTYPSSLLTSLAIVINNPILGGGSNLTANEMSTLLNCAALAQENDNEDHMLGILGVVHELIETGAGPTLEQWAKVQGPSPIEETPEESPEEVAGPYDNDDADSSTDSDPDVDDLDLDGEDDTPDSVS